MMPAEGPNPSEELLQRHARKRRDQGGDLALHPATRRLLQGEVARQYGAGAARPGRSWLRAWWWRGVIGAATAAVAVMIWHQANQPPVLSPTTQLAKAEIQASAPAPLAAPRAQSAPERRSEMVDLAANTLAFGTESAEAAAPTRATGADPAPVQAAALAVREQVATASKPDAPLDKAIAPVPEARMAMRSRGADNRLQPTPIKSEPLVAGKAMDLAAAAPPPPKPASLPSPSPATASAPDEPERFLRDAIPAPASRGMVLTTLPSASPATSLAPEAEVVLNRFVVEQQGQTIRIVDGDGSVYVGELGGAGPTAKRLESTPAQLRRASVEAQGGRAASDADAARSGYYSFRATGTNRTLQRQLTIDGRYSSATTSVGGAIGSPTARFYRWVEQPGLTNAPGAIEGRLWVNGSTNQHFFRARPMQR